MSFKALITEQTDSGYSSRLGEREIADLPAGDVLVKVHWSSLNFKDALSASGNKGVTRQFPHTPGIDAVGIVEQVDSGGPFQPGDKVICTGYDLGMNTAGGYGDYIRVPANWLVSLPGGLSARDAMVLGTAGLTGALCVDALLDGGLTQDQGEVLVTGATGGVGSTAVSILSRLGFQVVAVTGKEDAHDWLRQLGAQEVIGRDALAAVKGPMGKARWAGVVDCVGGEMLVNALKALQYGCKAACCGLAGSPNLDGLTVFPFILRGVGLLGVDSVELPLAAKQYIWSRLATDWRPNLAQLEGAEVTREQLPEWFERILSGGVRGRVVVKVTG